MRLLKQHNHKTVSPSKKKKKNPVYMIKHCISNAKKIKFMIFTMLQIFRPVKDTRAFYPNHDNLTIEYTMLIAIWVNYEETEIF